MSDHEMNPELEEEIQLLLTERNRKQRIENRIGYIDDLIPILQRELSVLSQILTKEEREYLKVRRKSVITLLAKLYVNYDKLLDKEYQEYVIAYTTYFDQLKRVENLKNEQEILRQTLSGLFGIEDRLQSLLKLKETNLLKSNPDFLLKFQEHQRRISARKLFLTELEQAHRAGSIAYVKLDRLRSVLRELMKLINNTAFIETIPYATRAKLREIQTVITPTVESLDTYSAELQDVSKKYRLSYHDELHNLRRFLKHLISRLLIDFVHRKELSGTYNFINDLLDESAMLQQTIQHEISQTEKLLEEDRIALSQLATQF